MQVIFLLLALLIQSAFAVGPLETKVNQFDELQGLLQRYCINNPNRASVKVLVNRTELNCNQLLALAQRLRSQIEDSVDDIQEACEEPRSNAEQLARQSAQVARQSVCRPASTDVQCLESFACSMASQIGQSIPIFGAPISSMVRSCRGNYSAGGCIQSIAKGIFDSLWGLISSVWDIGKAAVRGVGEWLGIIEAGENSTTERLMAAQRATRAYVSRFVRHPIDVLRESASAIFNGLKQAAMESYGCEQWADPMRPFVSRCLRPMTNWNCASCQQKFQVFCGIAGMAIGEIPSALLTGGAAGIASRIARTASAAIRANARVGRISRNVAELLGRFRPPAGLSTRLESIAARTARVMTAAERRVIERWTALKRTPLSQAVARAAQGVPASVVRQVAGYPLRAAGFYADAIEAAARMGFRAGDEAVASVIGNSERAIVREAATTERVAGSLSEVERDLPVEARNVSEVTAEDLRTLAGDTVNISDDLAEAGRLDDIPTRTSTPTPSPERPSGIVVSTERPTTFTPSRITEGGLPTRTPAAELRPAGVSPRNSVVTDVTTGRITVTSSEGEDLLRRLGGEHVSFQDREIMLDIIMGGPRRDAYFNPAGRFDDAFRNRYRDFERRLSQNPEELANYRRQVEALSRERVAAGNQRTLEELEDIKNNRLGVRDESFDCSNLARLTPGAFPTEGGNCKRLKFDEDVNGRYCSCGGMGKTSFTWLVRCPTRATDYHLLSTYVDELALPFDSAPEMCTRVDIPRGKECYIGPTSPTFAGFGGTTQILCENRAPRAPRGNPPSAQAQAAYEAQLEDMRRFGIQFGEPAVRPVRWAPFSTFTEYQNIVERAARACTDVCNINELAELQRDFARATDAIRARGNPAEIERLAVEQRNFDQYLRELREGRKTYPSSSELSPNTPAPVAVTNPRLTVDSRTIVSSNVPPSEAITTRVPAQTVRAPDITLSVAGTLDDEARLVAAERIIGNISGNEQRSQVLIRAHEVAPEHGFGTYTAAELREKTNVLRYNMSTDEVAAYRRANGGRYPPEVFSREEADQILRRGLAGNIDADEAFADARRASLKGKELRGRLRDGGNVTLDDVKTEFRASAQGYEVEARRTNSPQFAKESWLLYARSGDRQATLRMMESGVNDFGMNRRKVIEGMDQYLADLNRRIGQTNPANPALVLERDTLKAARDEAYRRWAPQTPTPQPQPSPRPQVAATPQPEPRPQAQTPAPTPTPQPQAPARPAIIVSEIPPRRAQDMANEFRLGTNGRQRDSRQAAELYYRASDGAIQRESRSVRTRSESNYMADRNFSEAFEQSLQADGAISLQILEDIHAASGSAGINAFLAENFQRFNSRAPTMGARANIRRFIDRVKEKYGNDLYDVQRNYLRSWTSANSDEALALSQGIRDKIQIHVAMTEPQEAFLADLIRRRGDNPMPEEQMRSLLDNQSSSSVAANRARPFRSESVTSFYPEGTSPDDVLAAFNRGGISPVSTNGKTTKFSGEVNGNRYAVYVCEAAECEAAGVKVVRGEITSITPECGPGIRALPKLSRAKDILRQSGPITRESFFVPMPCN